MIYFTSDPHYKHKNIVTLSQRPFSSIEEMDEVLIKNWNNIVSPEDTVYVLGDFSLSFSAVESYSSRLVGIFKVVPGNHDIGIHSFHKKGRDPQNRAIWKAKWESYGWEVLPEQITLDLSELGLVNLCHLPYSFDNSSINPQDHYQDKYEKWRPIDDGKVLLHGHVHNSFQTKLSPKGSPMVNVGVDQHNFSPISVLQIASLIQQIK